MENKLTTTPVEALSFPETDCIKITKVYDWVKLKSDQDFNFMIPLADQAAVQAAVDAGDIIKITANIPLDEASVVVSSINRDNVDDLCACVIFQKTLVVYITIMDITVGTVLSTFSKKIQLFDSTSLCIPSPLDASNIQASIVAAQADPLSTTPIDGYIMIEISTCQDFEVLLNLKALVKIEGLCSSRKGESCRGSVTCEAGEQKIPPQCPKGRPCPNIQIP